jgi:hypothetical protein
MLPEDDPREPLDVRKLKGWARGAAKAKAEAEAPVELAPGVVVTFADAEDLKADLAYFGNAFVEDAPEGHPTSHRRVDPHPDAGYGLFGI